MNNARKLLIAVFCVAVVGVIVLFAFRTPAASAIADTQPVAADHDAIVAKLNELAPKLDKVLPTLESVVDPEFRVKDAATALPVLDDMISLFGKLAAASSGEEKDMAMIAQSRYEAVAASLGDADLRKKLEASEQGSDAVSAFHAKSTLALVQWWDSLKDLKAQTKILSDYSGLALANPKDPISAETLYAMAEVGCANDDLSKSAWGTIKNLTSDRAKSRLGELAEEDEERAQTKVWEKELAAKFVGKPAEIQGRTSTGGTFSASELKGKVTLVDFWATWCVPCVAEMPEVKELYKKYQAQGFQIVGISDDDSDAKLNDFIKARGIPWIQLHDEAAQSGDDNRHAIQIKYEVKATPWMFLIDRKGILRYVDARSQTEEKIKLLLAENAGN